MPFCYCYWYWYWFAGCNNAKRLNLKNTMSADLLCGSGKRLTNYKTQIKLKLSNGHSPANLSNSSTRQKFAIFGECEYSPKRPFLETCETCQTWIRQKLHFMILAKLEFAKNYILRYSPHSPAFGECTMLSIERERLYFMYIERERLKGTSWNLFKFSLSPSHTHKTG